MSKKDFIALADALREMKPNGSGTQAFEDGRMAQVTLLLIAAVVALITVECFIRADAREQRRHAEAIRRILECAK